MYHFRLGKEEHVEGNEEDTEEEGQAVDGGGIADIGAYRGGEDGPAWDVPPVIAYMVRAAHLTPDEAYKTFNMGVGMSVICGRDDVDEVCEGLTAQGFSPFVMGECVAGKGEVTYR